MIIIVTIMFMLIHECITFHSNSFEFGNMLTKTNPVYFSKSMYIHLSMIWPAEMSTFLANLIHARNHKFTTFMHAH